MDIFNYLKEDGARAAERLNETAKNYSTWTMDRIFEEAKKAFESIKDHFARNALLENNLKRSEDVKSILAEVNKQEETITSEVEQIVEIHVDEPGFEQSLESIASKFNQYLKYCQETYYPAMKKNLTEDDLKKINLQLDQKVLG